MNFVLCNVDATTADKILKNLEVVDASGRDQISAKFLKDVTPLVGIYLANYVNLSIELDTFPSKCKIREAKLLLKNGINTEPKNDRPIYLLPIISKVIEKSIDDQTQIYVQINKSLYIYQSGLRANNFTDTFLCPVTDMVLVGAENGKHTGLVLIDCQKALDMLD